MTTNYTPTVEPFELETPFGPCRVSDIRVPHEGETMARIRFKGGQLTVNNKTYDSDVDFTADPDAREYNGSNGAYRVWMESYSRAGLTDNARSKIASYLKSPEVLEVFTAKGLLAKPDPAEVRDYKRERVYNAVNHELYKVLGSHGVQYHEGEKFAEAEALYSELVDEVLVKIVSRRSVGHSWTAIRNGDYKDSE